MNEQESKTVPVAYRTNTTIEAIKIGGKALIKKMDEIKWFRMAVCMLPPIVVGQVAAKLSNNQLSQNVQLVCWVLFLAGTLMYYQWDKIKARVADDQLEKETSGVEGKAFSDAENGEIEDRFDVLLTLCEGDIDQANRAVMVELRLNPSETMASATAVAIRRKQAEVQIAAAGRV